jgi:hypothetical protein
VIAEVKRKIDKLNALRVNEIEDIDERFFNVLKPVQKTQLNSENPGSIIDRLTILMLKKFHMELESERSDSQEDFRKKCSRKLATIGTQMNDLCSAFDELINDIQSGKRQFKLYKQFKMYNDPELNPVLYSKKTNV